MKKKHYIFSLRTKSHKPKQKDSCRTENPQREYQNFFPHDSIIWRLKGRVKSQLYNLHQQKAAPFSLQADPSCSCPHRQGRQLGMSLGCLTPADWTGKMQLWKASRSPPWNTLALIQHPLTNQAITADIPPLLGLAALFHLGTAKPDSFCQDFPISHKTRHPFLEYPSHSKLKKMSQMH